MTERHESPLPSYLNGLRLDGFWQCPKCRTAVRPRPAFRHNRSRDRRMETEAPRMTERITRNNLPNSTDTWPTWRKRTLTRALPIGPFKRPVVVETLEGEITLPAGWFGAIAVDAKGHPYPIDEDVFRETYEVADE